MRIRLRIIQEFDPAHEREFMELESQFAQLEARRPDFPKGRRWQPIAGPDPTHTLIWEAEFDSLDQAHRALSFFEGDAAHEALAAQQRPYFRRVRLEFHRLLGR